MNYNEIIWSAIGSILTAVATWIGAYIVKWLNTKVNDKKFAKLATELTTLVTNCVKNVFQTYVETLKSEDKFDEECQKVALEKCITLVKAQMTSELKEYLEANYADVKAYLTSLVEASIYSLKNGGK